MRKIAAAVFGALSLLAFGSAVQAAESAPSASTLTIYVDRPGAKIERNIYGQFVEHLGRGVYEGIWVGERSAIPNTEGYRNDVLAALRRIRVPVVRWPGGCFGETYNWRDGIGPRDRRTVTVNAAWGGVEESNAFGSHEYMRFAELLGAKTFISGNVATGTPREMSQWVEYLTSPANSTLAQERRRNGRAAPFKLDFIGIGNETWGCGGQMRPEYYTDLARQYANALRTPEGQTMARVAVGPNADDYNWTEVLMAGATRAGGPGSGAKIDAIGLHYYTFPSGGFGKKGAATGFGEDQWIGAMDQTLKIGDFITRHSAIMDKYDPEKKIALFVDEWGVWADAEPNTNPRFLYQQNSLRDALIAALNFNIFHAHADRVRMANIAQMVNVLQSMILTDKEKMLLTPTYHLFDMYKVFQDAIALPLEIKTPNYSFGGKALPNVQATAARGADGIMHVGLVNVDPIRPANLNVTLAGSRARSVTGQVLTADRMDAHNSFAAPNSVKPAPFNGARFNGSTLTVSMPPKSVVVLELR